MRLAEQSGLGLALLLLGGVVVPPAARAQPGLYVKPSFSVAEVYDDNLFSTAERRQTDFINRLSTGVEVGYQSAPLTLFGRYDSDAEVFARHRELSTAQARQRAAAEIRYLPDPSMTLAFRGEYLTTEAAAELNTQTGLETGRLPAQRLIVGPSITFGFDPFTTGMADYTFTRDEQSGGIDTDVHAGHLGLDRRLTVRDTGSLGYIVRQFAFEGDGTTTAHVFTLGWMRDLTATTSVTLRGGPNFTDGSVEPEASASVRRRLRNGELTFTYERTQTTAFGLPGVVQTESFIGVLAYQFLRLLRIRTALGFITSTQASVDARVYQAELEATYQITRWLTLAAAYRFAFQQRRLDPATPHSEDILHNVVTLSLAFSYPYRLR